MNENQKKTMLDWSQEIHEWAKSKGWWSRPTDNIAGKLLLVHSEISEAAEELRGARPCPHGAPDVNFNDLRVNGAVLNDGKPTGFPSEIADALIRLLDLCARIGIDPDAVVAEKMAYNHKREYRHGGKGL